MVEPIEEENLEEKVKNNIDKILYTDYYLKRKRIKFYHSKPSAMTKRMQLR